METTNDDALEGVELQPPRRKLFGRSGATGANLTVVHRTRQSEYEIPVDLRNFRLRRRLAVADVLGLAIGWTALLGASLILDRPLPSINEIVVFTLLVPVWILGAGVNGLYHLSERRVSYFVGDEFGPVLMLTTGWIWAYLVLASIVTPEPVPILPTIALWGGAIAAILALRALVRTYLRRMDWWTTRVILVGSPRDLDRVATRVRRHPEYGIELVGSVQMEGLELLRRYQAPGRSDYESDLLLVDGSDYADVVLRTLSEAEASHVIVTDWPASLEERSEFLGALISAGVHVDLVSGEPDALMSAATLQHLEGMWMLTMAPHRTNRSSAFVKRVIDLAGSGIALLFLSPLLAYAAVRIKLESPGPVMFRQERIGRDGEPFQILKLRTMVHDAEARKDDVAHLSFHADGDPRMFKIAADPRVTKFGAKLRRWSVDELPQLWNVFRGDMSLVGPRPLIPEEAQLVEGFHGERTIMRPGITGPWQTLGRSEIPFAEMVRLDYMYVSTWTVRGDLSLLVKTASVVAGAQGAY